MTTIAFVCIGNAGRSQIAAAFARRRCGEKATILSGGTRPAARVNPLVVEAMKEVGIDISLEVPRAMDPQELAACDYVVTMGCATDDVCPVNFRGDAVDWGLPDPSGKPLGEVRLIRDEIRRRVDAFLDEVGL